MLIDRPQVTEGSEIVNATVPSGTALPSNPNIGELFYLTAIVGALNPGFVVYAGTGTWKSIYDQTQAQSPSEHIADTTLHITAAQNTLLDGLNTTLTATELNYVDGVTSPIQTQFNTLTSNLSSAITASNNADAALQTQITNNLSTFNSHAGDLSLHLTAAQNNLLDGLVGTLTATELNYVDGVTAPIQSQLNTLSTNLSSHTGDGTLHLTAAQNTLLDGLTATLTATELNYVDGVTSPIQTQLNALSSGKLSKAGDTMNSGADLTFVGGGTVTGLPLPTNATDAASKDYVDGLVQGLSWKTAVRVATTTNITLSGLQTIDGVVLTTNDRVLVKNQTTQSQNGIYLVSSTAWSRAADANTATELNGASVFVTDGTLHQDTAWVQTQVVTTLGTSSVIWSQFAAAGGATAGQGILIAGSTISVRAGNGLTFSGQDLTLNVNSDFALGSQLALSTQLSLTPGTYGSSTLVPVINVDSKGRLVSVSTASIGSSFQPVDADLTALAGLSTTGIIVRDGAGSVVTRQIGASGVGITIANATGVGGNPTVQSNATNLNTVNTIVSRDGSGNFSAGTITASLNGNATTATTATTANSAAQLTTARTIGLSGVTATAQSFNGTANITIPITAVPTSLLTGTVADGQISGAYTGITSLTMSGNLNFSTVGDTRIQNNGTSDGADTGRLLLLSGGSATSARGGYIVISGNESSSTGYVNIVSGDAGGINLNGGAVGTTVNGTGGLTVASGVITGNGSGLTNLDASDLATGTVPSARLTGSYAISITGSAASASTATTLATTRTFSITGAAAAAAQNFNGSQNVVLNVTDLNASNLSSGTVPDARISGSYSGITTLATSGAITIGSTGLLRMQPGSTTRTGYVEFIYNGGNRQGYIGYASTNASTDTGTLNYVAASHAFNGSIVASGNVTAFSDLRLKTNVDVIPDALNKVEAIRGVTYDRIADGKRDAGVIAQEVQKVLPEVVVQHEEYLSVDYGKMVGLLIEAIKELRAEVQELKSQIAGK